MEVWREELELSTGFLNSMMEAVWLLGLRPSYELLEKLAWLFDWLLVWSFVGISDIPSRGWLPLYVSSCICIFLISLAE